jgi:hypothetical protein
MAMSLLPDGCTRLMPFYPAWSAFYFDTPSNLTKRKVIEVRDRKGLLDLAADIYGVSEVEQRRLTGWSSKGYS